MCQRWSGEGQEGAGSKQLPRRVAAPYLWREVDIGASVEQQLSHIQVFIVRSDVQRRESSLGGGGGESTCTFQIITLTVTVILRLCNKYTVHLMRFVVRPLQDISCH